MKRKLTSVELAEAWQAGEMPLRTAVKRHWKQVGLWPVNEEVLFVLELIVGLANVGMMDRRIPVGEDEEMTVGQAIERFRLSDLLG